jgi:hypothetical protein
MELSSMNEQEQTWFLLAKAWERFWQQPNVLLQTLGANLRQFIIESAPTLLTGAVTEDRLKASWLASFALLPGVAYGLKNRTAYLERSFWFCLFVSAGLSAAIILKDGRRAMLVTDALMAWFLALGFTAPAVVTRQDNTVARWRWQTGAAVLAILSAVFFLVPAFSRALFEREIASHAPLGQFADDKHVIAGGERMTGLLVVADEADAGVGVPALAWSKFVELVGLTRLEEEHGPFLKELSNKIPFAFVTGIRFIGPRYSTLYIAPPELIQQRDAWAWRLTLAPRPPNSPPFFRRVLTAEKVW